VQLFFHCRPFTSAHHRLDSVMKGNNFINPELKAHIIKECIENRHFCNNRLKRGSRKIILSQYPSVQPQTLTYIVQEYCKSQRKTQASSHSTTSTTTKCMVVACAAKKKKEKLGRPVSVCPFVRSKIDEVGQTFANKYEICNAAEMHRQLNAILLIGDISYTTVRRYMKENLQQEKHVVTFYLSDDTNPRYSEIENSLYDAKTGKRNKNPRYFYSPHIHSKSNPYIMLWPGIHCPNHFLESEYERQDGFKVYNESGASETYRLVPEARPAHMREVQADHLDFNLQPAPNNSIINEDEVMSHERA